MSAYPWTAWLWWSGGAMLGLLGLWLLYWSLLKDRAKGRRRCPKCWYDMSATEGLRCSECGYEAKHEKKLLKTRRRKCWALVALVLLIAGHVSHTAPRMQQAGWIGTIPTTVLIIVAPWRYEMGWNTTKANQNYWARVSTKELKRRLWANETWQWQRHQLARRVIDPLINNTQEIDPEYFFQICKLFEFIDEDTSVVHPQLLELLKSKDKWRTECASYLLSQNPTDDPLIHNAIAALLKHEDELISSRATKYLIKSAKNNPEFVIPKLIEAMHDLRVNVCCSAIRNATKMGSAGLELIPTITELTNHENKKIRDTAIYTLMVMELVKKQMTPNTPDSSN